ncbi:MAG: hypothetical protein SH859_00055 [Hyphomicrobium aestuarii]|nr:hypothetical protein [Hyphomicrobium aestuarii]
MNRIAPDASCRKIGGLGLGFYAPAVALLLSLMAPPAFADADGLAGRWSGNGSVMLPSGATEKARCRATIRKAGSREFTVDATCATSSLKVSQVAKVQASGANRFSGEFLNAEYNITGTMTLTLSGKTLSAALRGGGGTAFFTLAR